jgi:hypothetical protein
LEQVQAVAPPVVDANLQVLAGMAAVNQVEAQVVQVKAVKPALQAREVQPVKLKPAVAPVKDN